MKKSFIFRLLVYFCLFLFFKNIFTQDVFIPTREPDLAYFPPFTSNLLKAERVSQNKEEYKNIESIVKKVANSSDKELEKQAAEIVKDKTKLDQLLSIMPQGKPEHLNLQNKQQDRQDIIFDSDIKLLVDSFYEDLDLTEAKVSLKLKDSDIKNAIELIGRAANLNFAIDSNVLGTVSNINFEDISVSNALKSLLSNNKPVLTLIKNYDIWTVMRLSDALPILKNIIQEKNKKDLSSTCVTIYNSKWSESFKNRVEKMWNSIIELSSNKSNNYLVFDDNTKKIFVRGKAEEIKDFKKYLKEIDSKIPQVKIEARVIITSKDFEESFGLQVSGVYNRRSCVSNGWNMIGFGPVKSPNGGGDFKPGQIMDWALNLLPTTASKYLNFPFIFGGKDLDNKRLNLVLNAAENRSEIKTILKPCLLVNSEEPAEILVGQEVPIETNIQERIDGSLRSMDTINYKAIGMKLKVKPIVAPDKKSVFLDIFVENSYIKSNCHENCFDAKKSIIATTKSRNRVLLKSGQTTLIGGLITSDHRKDKNGVPILQEIPILGYLFQGTNKYFKDEQLMIFISPTIA